MAKPKTAPTAPVEEIKNEDATKIESTTILGGASEGASEGGASEGTAASEGGSAEGGGAEDKAAALLESIRSKRRAKASEGTGKTDSGKSGSDARHDENNEGGNGGSNGGAKRDDGPPTKPNRGNGRQDRQAPNGDGLAGQTSPTPKQSGGLKLDGFKGGKGAAGGISFPTPQLGEVLTDKESKEYKEKMSAVLLTIFRYMDEGITATNAHKVRAQIWSDMDDDDLSVFVEVLIGGAKKSRIVATAVRQVAKAHNMLRIGIITGPRFMATVKHYQNNGGFSLFGNPRQEVDGE